MIEKGIPIPRKKVPGSPPDPRGKYATRQYYPWNEMEVGDSFLVTNRKASTLSASMTSATRRTGFKFTARTLEKGVRIWRIE